MVETLLKVAREDFAELSIQAEQMKAGGDDCVDEPAERLTR